MGYKLEPTSEQLGKSWTTDVQAVDAGGVIGTVGTNTSYVDAVQGTGQTSVFQSIGWPAVRQVIEAKADEIVGFFSAALDDYLSYLVKK
jgi:hypothetical protein